MEIKNIYGAIIYSDDSKSLRETVYNAVKKQANLFRANLEGANLEGAKLERANLFRANLEGANLEGAKLERANLFRANLEGANLEGAKLERANLFRANLFQANLFQANLFRANLEGANLEGAKLERANLEGANLEGAMKIPIYCKWSHSVTDNQIHIGCEKRTIEEWKKFLESDEEIETKRDSKEFKQIEAVIRGYVAYLECLT
jgi:hypothetical protein